MQNARRTMGCILSMPVSETHLRQLSQTLMPVFAFIRFAAQPLSSRTCSSRLAPSCIFPVRRLSPKGFISALTFPHSFDLFHPTLFGVLLHSCLPSIGHATLQQPPSHHASLLIIFLRLLRLRMGRTGAKTAAEFIRFRSTTPYPLRSLR